MESVYVPLQNKLPLLKRIKKADGKIRIYDPIRKKWIISGPEELVRQCLLLYLTDDLEIASTRIAVERSFTIAEKRKRIDICIYENGHPFLLVECKAPEVSLRQDHADQIAVYNVALRAPYLMLTNGLSHFFFDCTNRNKITSISINPLLLDT